MARAGAVPALRSGDPPVSILVDYDGTVSLLDVGDALLARHGPDPALVATKDAEYDAGRTGSRELIRWDMDVLPRDAALLRAEAAAIPQDAGFAGFVAGARAAGVLVEVVSDGLGFYVEPNLAALDPRLADLPIATNENAVRGGGAGVTFPYSHPACFVCGTCKRERVRLHRESGRLVVFVGDGTSDRYAANHADIVFAKDSLLAWARRTERSARAWTHFGELSEWLRDGLADGGELPRTAAQAAAGWARRPLPAFICGPEAWGPGRSVPVGIPGREG